MRQNPERFVPVLVLLLAVVAFSAACGPDASGTDGAGPAGGAAAPALPLGEGRPDVSGITRIQLRDDERVAVTRVRFAPGAAEPLHTHDFDLLVVPLSSAAVEWRWGDEVVERLEPGDVQFVPRGVVHQLVSREEVPFEVIAVGLK